MAHATAMRTLDEVESLRLIWNALLVETADHSFFQTLDWYRFALEVLSPDAEPFVLTVDSGGKTVGILPLIMSDRSSPVGRIRRLTSPPAPEGALFRPIGRGATATLISSARYLESHPLWWDYIDLAGIDKTGWDRGRTVDAFANAGMRLRRGEPDVTCCIDLQDDVSALAPCNDVDVNWKQIQPDPAHCGDGDPEWDTFDSLLMDQGWSELWIDIDGQLNGADGMQSLAELHGFASQRGAANVVVLMEQERALGFVYCLTINGQAFQVAEGIADTGNLEGWDTSRIRSVMANGAARLLRESGCHVWEQRVRLGDALASRAPTIVRERYRGYAKSGSRVALLRMLRLLRSNRAS